MTDRHSGLRAPIYLDHHATTPMDPRVIAAMTEALCSLYGNPNSVQHAQGRAAAAAMERARQDIALFTGSDPRHVHFTTGASDAIQKALASALSDLGSCRAAAMSVEHPAMIRALNRHAQAGDIEIDWLEVDGQAQLSLACLTRALNEGATLVCLMMANNEVGTIYPVEAVMDLCEAHGARLVVDATQAAGRLDLGPIGERADYLILSGHKIYGPKGVGALVTRHLPSGADGEGFADGTPNAPAISSFGLAARIAMNERLADVAHAKALRDRLEAGLKAALPGVIINGDLTARLPHSLHVSIPGAVNEAIVARIGDQVAISTGAACASGAQEPSHVLRAMALAEPLVDGALRLSTGRFNTEQEIDAAVMLIAKTANDILGVRMTEQTG